MDCVTTGEDLLEERRRAGDPGITPEGREILLRLTTGDLMDDFQPRWTPMSKPTRSSVVTTLTTKPESLPSRCGSTPLAPASCRSWWAPPASSTSAGSGSEPHAT
jgi:hypothetical protein